MSLGHKHESIAVKKSMNQFNINKKIYDVCRNTRFCIFHIFHIQKECFDLFKQLSSQMLVYNLSASQPQIVYTAS